MKSKLHPHTAAIADALDSGASVAGLAREYGVNTSTMRMFVKRHIRRDQEAIRKKSDHNMSWAVKNPERAKAHRDKYRTENQETVLESSARWRAENSARVRAYNARRYWENPEQGRVRSARWRTENPDQARAKDARWRAANILHIAMYNTLYYARKQVEKSERRRDELYGE